MLNDGSRGHRSGPFSPSSFSPRMYRGRAGFSGRGGRSARGSSRQKFRPQDPPNTSLHPLGDLLASVDNSFLDLAVSSQACRPSITDCCYKASYNWLNEKIPTILIPDIPQRLDEDSGNYFRDANAARYPGFPTEPAVRALLETDTSFCPSSVDVFACGSTLGNLLRFVRHIDKPFRFSAEVVGHTVFFVRKENDPRELIDGVRGYGHTFPESYTTWEKEIKGSETHQRLVQYRFAGMRCVVRFECDGYLRNAETGESQEISKAKTSSAESDIVDLFAGVAVDKNITESGHLTMKLGGSEVPQRSIFDLKTRSGKYGKQIDMEDQLPSLWIKQIPNFIVAYHDGQGLFLKEKIQIHDMKEDLLRWEKANADALKRLAALIRKIIDFAKESKDGRIDIYCPSINHLEIRKQRENVPRVLPASLIGDWMSRSSATASSLTSSQDGPAVGRPSDKYTVSRKLDAESSSDDSAVDFDDYYDDFNGTQWVDQEEPDYTACSADDCGYCGRCTY